MDEDSDEVRRPANQGSVGEERMRGRGLVRVCWRLVTSAENAEQRVRGSSVFTVYRVKSAVLLVDQQHLLPTGLSPPDQETS